MLSGFLRGRTVVACLLAGFAAGLAAAEDYRGHKLVRVLLQTPEDEQAMLAVSGDFWAEGIRLGGFTTFRVPPDRVDELDATGLAYVVTLDDIATLIERERAELERDNALRDLAWFANYKDPAQINARLDELVALRPDLASKTQIGSSIQGRPIYALRIADPAGPADRPGILVNGCQHAREWVSPMTMMYFADRLIELQPTDARIAALLQEVEFWIVPMVNPDGYAYTWTDQRLWRKNRRNNGDGTFGVDLNRNWDAGWGGPGASPDTSDETYHGTAPFSEPESQALRNLVLAHPNVRVTIDYHSYSQLVLRPFGTVEDEPAEPDRSVLRSLGDGLAASILAFSGETYVSQPIYDLYLASGSAADWGYDQGVWGLSIELRPETSNPGFVLPAAEIAPTGAENFAAFLDMSDRVAAGLELEHTPPAIALAGAATPVSITALEVGGFVDSMTLYARVGGSGPFAPSVLGPASPPAYAGALPSAACGEAIQYYFEAVADDGRVVRLPAAAPGQRFALHSLEQSVVRNDDMEAAAGWTGGAAGDTATTGVWTRVNPNGTAAQPEDDHSPAPGTVCWVTGQGAAGGGVGDNDVDGGRTTLLTPVLDLSAAPGAAISYWRWYSNDAGSAAGADAFRVEITNDGSSWTPVETVGPTGPETQGGWFEHTFRVSDVIAPTATVRVRFIAEDADSGSIIEAAIDDFRVTTSGCSDQCAGDATGNGVVDLDDLLITLGAFGRCLADDGYAGSADFDLDGCITLDDLLIVLGSFGGACP